MESKAEEKDMLNKIVDGSDTAVVIKPKAIEPIVRVKKELHYDLKDGEECTMTGGLITFINSKHVTLAELMKYFIDHGNTARQAARLAHNLDSGLEHGRDIRLSSFDIWCDFLNVDAQLVTRKE